MTGTDSTLKVIQNTWKFLYNINLKARNRQDYPEIIHSRETQDKNTDYHNPKSW